MKALMTWAAVALAASILASPASAADPVRGKALYMAIDGAQYSCGSSSCHTPDPSANINNVQKASTGAAVLTAINSVAVMNYWLVIAPGKAVVTSVDADDIAAYIVNPASGTATPAATLSPTTLSFGNQVTGTTSATMSATLKNSGTANLVLSSVTLGGTNSADFTRGGTCAAALTLAPAQTCSIDVMFKPTVIGTRSATVTVAHNASPSTSTLNVTGSGIAAPTPAAGLSATTLAFGNQTVGLTSAPRTVTITNTGSATLTLGTITTTGSNPGDFAPSGCSGSSLAAGMGCTISVTFTPSALNARSATLSIPSNAAGSPHGVALTGNGTAAPAPAVTLNPTSLAFGNQTTGTTSSAKTISLTNSGTAGLGINSITASGAGFAATNTCPVTLAAGASCSISVTFAPTTVASYTGSVAISTTAAGSPHSVSISGSGIAPAPTAPVATLSPTAVDFGTSTLNTSSTPNTVTLTNSGNAPLAITAWNLSGTNPGDFAETNTCPAGSSLPAGATCTVSVQFTPTDTGTRLATVTLTSNAAGSPAIDLKGTGVVQASAMAQVSPTQMTFSKTRVGKTSSARTIRVRNTGTTPLTISSIGTTGDFAASSDCASAPVAPGGTCAVKVQFAPTAAGTRTGALTVASNAAGSPHVVSLTGTGVEGGRRASSTSGAGSSTDCEEDEAACSQSLSPFSFSR